jgi:hypothetical protein
MAEHTLFGAALALDASYDNPNVQVGGGYRVGQFVKVTSAGKRAVKMRWRAANSAPSFPGYGTVWALLYGAAHAGSSAPNELLAAKAFGTITAGAVNEITFDTPVNLTNGRYYLPMVYLPNAAWPSANGAFNSEVVSATEPTYVGVDADELQAAVVSPGNGVFDDGTLADPAASTYPTLDAFGNRHYGVDLTIDDQAVAAPTNSVAPAVTGTAETGQTLTCSQGTWTGSPTSYAYQWQRNTGSGFANISGATASTHVVVSGDETFPVRCVVTATNAGGSTSANSNSVTPQAPASGVPANTVAPVITTDGTPQTGETITCSTGTWTNTPTSYAYQWQRAGTNISGATSASHLLDVADVGLAIRCVVTATNATGAGTPANSNAVTPSAPSSSGYVAFGWANAPSGWVPGDPAPTGSEAAQLTAARMEAFGSHIHGQATSHGAVHVGPTQPTSPLPNTLWIKTDVDGAPLSPDQWQVFS